MKKQDGFTLIEWLIALAILGILVSIVAITIQHSNEALERNAQAEESHLVQGAINAYLNEVGVIPVRTIPAIIRIGDKDAPFTKYLYQDTKYEYTWNIVVTIHPDQQ